MMIYFKADENKKVIMFTKSARSAADYHLTETCGDDGLEKAYNGCWYVKGYAPEKPHDIDIKEQIEALEAQITDRNLRGAILGDEWALNKVQEIEAQIAELRKQLEA